MDKRIWYFTFLGDDPKYRGYCQPIRATSFSEARSKMFELHGDKWAFQYDEDTWNRFKSDTRRLWPMERELEVINA